MTNILLLPQFSGAGSSFSLVTNGDWLQSILFTAPGSPPNALTMVGAITSGQSTVTVGSTIGLVPGQPINQIPGIPAGAFVGSISSATQFSMVNSSGSSLDATETNAEAQLVFQPLPLDLTGIEFTASMRAAADSAGILLTASTANGTIINGGAAGTLQYNVPYSQLPAAGSYVIDIVASGDEHTVNLFPQGPATVTIVQGVTVPPAS
jgi:hypothetical protein